MVPDDTTRYVISIHALREEGDPGLGDKWFEENQISIHALREEGDTSTDEQAFGYQISIHALREEGDPASVGFAVAVFLFLSTPSARRATVTAQCYLYKINSDFYPRPPRGGRQQKQRQNLYFLINYTTFCTNLEEP